MVQYRHKVEIEGIEYEVRIVTKTANGYSARLPDTIATVIAGIGADAFGYRLIGADPTKKGSFYVEISPLKVSFDKPHSELVKSQ